MLALYLAGPLLNPNPHASMKIKTGQQCVSESEILYWSPGGNCCSIVVPGAPYNININTLQANPTSIEDKIRL